MRPKGIASVKASPTPRVLRLSKTGREESMAAGSSVSSAPARAVPHQSHHRVRRCQDAGTEERGRGDQKTRLPICSSTDRRPVWPAITTAFVGSTQTRDDFHPHATIPAVPAPHSAQFSSWKRPMRTKVGTLNPTPSARQRRTVIPEVLHRRSVSSYTSRNGNIREDRGTIGKVMPTKRRSMSGNDPENRNVSSQREKSVQSVTFSLAAQPQPQERIMPPKILKKCSDTGSLKSSIEIPLSTAFTTPLISEMTQISSSTVESLPLFSEEKSASDSKDVKVVDSKKDIRVIDRCISQPNTDDFEWEEVRKDKFSTSWETLDEEDLISSKGEGTWNKRSKSVEGNKLNEKGWEEVVFSVHVHVPPNADPDAAVMPIAEVHPSQKHSLSKKKRKFQAASEILVLPILTRKHRNDDNPKLENAKAIQSLKDVIDVTSDGKQNTKCHFLANWDENTKVLSSDTYNISIDELGQETNVKCLIAACNTPFALNKLDYSHAKIDEKSDKSDKSLFNEKISRHKVLDIKLPHCSLEIEKEECDDVGKSELSLHQQDFVKVVHEMEAGTSKCDATTSTHSVGSKDILVEALHKVTSFSDISPNSSAVSTSFCMTKSYPGSKGGKGSRKSDTPRDDEIKLIGEETETGKDTLDSLTLDSKSTSQRTEKDKLEDRLPILLHQNEKVRQILERVVTKLEESNELAGAKLFQKLTFNDIPDDPVVEKTLAINEEQNTYNVSVSDGDDKVSGSVKSVSDKPLSSWSKESKEDVEKETFAKCWRNIPTAKSPHYEALLDDEVTVSDVDTKHSYRNVSESEAEEGDDEADLTSEEVRTRETDELASGVEGDPPDEPPNQHCYCQTTGDICLRHPSVDQSGGKLQHTCECDKHNTICPLSNSRVEGMRPSDDVSDFSMSYGPSNSSGALRILSHGESPPPEIFSSTQDNVSAPSNVPQNFDPDMGSRHSGADDDWIPWAREGPTNEVIPEYAPAKTNTVSVITLPPKLAPKAFNIFRNPNEESLSTAGDLHPDWVPGQQSDVPETISEFHWMPDGVRGFSSTIISPEIPDDMNLTGIDNRPYLLAPGHSRSTVTLDSGTREAMSASRAGKRRNTRTSVTSSRGASGFGGELIQVITNAVEKGLAPLRISIDEIRAKIEKLETCGNSALKPDILVGVSAVPQCIEQKCALKSHGNADYTCVVGGGSGNMQEVNMPACVGSISPYGVVMLRQPSAATNREISQGNSGSSSRPDSDYSKCEKVKQQDATQQVPSPVTGDRPRCPDDSCRQDITTVTPCMNKTAINTSCVTDSICTKVKEDATHQIPSPLTGDRLPCPNESCRQDIMMSENDGGYATEPAPAPPQFRDDGPSERSPASGGKKKNENMNTGTGDAGTVSQRNIPPPEDDDCCEGFCKLPPEQRRRPQDRQPSLVKSESADKWLAFPPKETRSSDEKRQDAQSSPSKDIQSLKDTGDTSGKGMSQVIKRPDRCKPKEELPPVRSASLGPPMSRPMSGAQLQREQSQNLSPSRSPLQSATLPTTIDQRPQSPARSLPLPSETRFPPCVCKPVNPPAKQPLSPIAQMYLDLSKAKHDWSENPEAAGKGKTKTSSAKRGPSSQEVTDCRCSRFGANAQKVTLRFARDINPLIDVSLVKRNKVANPGRTANDSHRSDK